MNPFETETMADLCLRQGHHDEALAIYRRLRARTEDRVIRERIDRRLAILEGEASSRPGPPPKAPPPDVRPSPASAPPLPMPGVRARCFDGQVTVEWRLPAETIGPVIEILLVKTGAGGVATETRTIEVDSSAGQVVLTVSQLHSARAAAGRRGDGRFVPLVRG